MQAVDKAANFLVGGSSGAPLRRIARIGFQVTAGTKGVQQERGEALKAGGGGSGMFLRACGSIRIASEFVEADGNSLAEVHGAVLFTRGNTHKPMAVAEVFVREAAFLRAEEQSDSASSRTLAEVPGSLVEATHRVLQLTKAYGGGSHNKSAIPDGFGNGLVLFGVGEQRRGTDGGTRLTKGEFVGVHYPKMEKAEVAHGAGSCSDVERIARSDEDYPQAVGFGVG